MSRPPLVLGLVLLLLLPPLCAAAQVLVVDQFADMEASAAARCPGEVWPKADFISANYGSISGLDGLAGGYAQLTSVICIRVESPTQHILSMQSSSSRVARELPGGDIITNDGDTLQDVNFRTIFDAGVVGSDARVGAASRPDTRYPSGAEAPT